MSILHSDEASYIRELQQALRWLLECDVWPDGDFANEGDMVAWQEKRRSLWRLLPKDPA